VYYGLLNVTIIRFCLFFMLYSDARSPVFDPSHRVFIDTIPETLYQKMESVLCDQYHFKNGQKQGGRMCLATNFVGVDQRLATQLFALGKQLTQQFSGQVFTQVLPDGFSPPQENLSSLERQGDAAFFHLDVAITADGPKLIEFQAVPTYQVTAARLGSLLQQEQLPQSQLFLGDRDYQWHDFKRIMQDVLSAGASGGQVIMDRHIQQQKTNFEFYATQTEILPEIEVVDAHQVYAQDGALYFQNKQAQATQIQRLYNRVLTLEAIDDDHYPHPADPWHFRYDQPYQGLEYCNHPAYSFMFAKQQLTQVIHPFNPQCYELAETATLFMTGELACEDYVWKHKLGVAGREIFLSPTIEILQQLQAEQVLEQYIAQQKVQFHPFLSADQQEKIVELRLMFVQSPTDLIAVPMARIGHLAQMQSGQIEPRIHFADNNKPGYGFAPVVLHS